MRQIENILRQIENILRQIENLYYMDYGSIASSVLGGAYNLLGTMYANDSNKTIAKQNRYWQTEENDKAREFQREMWNAENAYNTPAAIMERYREAGLNPYLADAQQANAQSQPVPAVGFQSAPNQPIMQAPNFSFADYLLKAKAVDANSANQTSQSLDNLAKASRLFYDLFGEDKTKEIMLPYLKSILGASFDGNNYSLQMQATIKNERYKADLNQVEFDIKKAYGAQHAERVIYNMDYEYQKSVAQVGLWSSLARLNDSNIERNYADIKELISRAYRNFADAMLAKEKSISESTLRPYFKDKLMLAVGNDKMDLIDRYSDFSESEFVRSLKMSDKGKLNRKMVWSLDSENNAFLKGIKSFSSVVNDALGFTKLRSPGVSRSPYDYVRYKQKSMTPQGRPFTTEWFDVR